jgi:hypothetical protein
MSLDRMNLYLHKALVDELGINDTRFVGRDEKELGKFNSNTDEEWNFTDPNGYNYVSLDRIKSKIVQFMDNK